MTILITLTTVGLDCSTFDIYSNVDGFLSAFETDVPKASLSAGFSSANVPDGTTIIRVKAKGLCSNYIDLNLEGSPITTTTTSSSSSTTTTTSTSTTLPPITCHQWQISTTTNGGATFTNCSGITETIHVDGANGIGVTNFCSLSSDPSEITLLPNTSLNYIGVCME